MSKEQEIREVFERFGGTLSTRRLAELLVECGTFDEDELLHLAMRQIQNIARRALKDIDRQGLPYAGPSGPEPKEEAAGDDATERQSPVWVQRELWDYDTACYNLHERAGGIMADVKIYKRLRTWTEGKFGQAPADPFGWNPD